MMDFDAFLRLLFGALLVYAASGAEPTQRVLSGPPEGLAASANTLNFTSPSPYIFSSLRSLLQQWPNTFFPNGHSIVPCQVPAYTNLYHARWDDQIPPDPEWFAFDIEMSYGIFGNGRNAHMLTYQSVKPIGCLYFDGMSAALAGTGQLDSQMVFLYGNTTGPSQSEPAEPGSGLFGELRRAQSLCQWVRDNDLGGLGWGVEGIVRMNAGFEMIWCNFSSPSIKLVSHLNVTAPLLPESLLSDEDVIGIDQQRLGRRVPDLKDGSARPTHTMLPLPSSTTKKAYSHPSLVRPPDWKEWAREPFTVVSVYEWFRSATWHYGSSGMGPGRAEQRVKPLMCGFMSYYDPAFHNLASGRATIERHDLNLSARGLWQGPGQKGNRSMALKELTRRRRHHTLATIDPKEAPIMNAAIADYLRAFSFNGTSRNFDCTGIDWVGMSHEISARYFVPLLQLSHVLASPPPPSVNGIAARKFLAQARHKSHGLILPFMEYPASAQLNSTFGKSEWTLGSQRGRETFSRCKYSYTRLHYNTEGKLRDRIGRQERVMIEATEDVLAAICIVIIQVGFQIEYEWLSRWNTPNATAAYAPSPSITDQALSWKEDLEQLMAWLGWAADEVRCEELCSADEYCYIPMWPLIFLGDGPRRNRRPYYSRPDHGRRPVPPDDGHPPYSYGSSPPKWASPPGFPDLELDLWRPRCMRIRG
jgi:hypothetical protein